MFPKSTLILLAMSAVAVNASPADAGVAATEAASGSEFQPVTLAERGIAISQGVATVTWSGTNCRGTNQGTTLNYGGSKCVNWSNAGSFDLQRGTSRQCDRDGKSNPTIIFFHNTGCTGDIYATSTLSFGCWNLASTPGGHGSGLIVC